MTTESFPPQTEQLRGTGPLSRNGGPSHELAAELARLRERFVAYERLDHQLDEMVTGLTDLLRGAAELRRRTNQDIATAIVRCEELIAADRAHHRGTLASLLGDIDGAQRRVASLTAAIAVLQTELAGIARRLPGPAKPEPSTSDSRSPAPDTPVAAPTSLDLTIRGVPNVASALTMQRFVAGLDQVASTQTLEYAAGELRLHLETDRPFAAADLGGFPNGSFDVVDEQSDRLVLRYIPPDAA